MSGPDYRLLFDQSPMGIMGIDGQGFIRIANEAAARQLGYDFDEFLGLNINGIEASEDRARLEPHYAAMRRGESPRFQTRHRRKNGSLMDVEVVLRLVEYGGEMIGYLFCRDITAAKRMEADLLMFNELVVSMAEGVAMTRTSDGTIVYANTTFERMFGYLPGELEGRNVVVLNAPGGERPEAVAAGIQAQLVATGIWSGIIRNVKKDGTLFWCSAKVTTMEHHRYGTVWLGVHQDITARMHAEDEIQRLNKELENRVRLRTAELEEANKSLSETLEYYRKSREALQQEKNKSEAVISAIGDGLSIQDRDFTILHQNAAQRAIIGDHVGRKCHTAYEGRDRVCEGCPMERAFLDGQVYSSERRVVINGEERFFTITASPVRNADGAITGGVELVKEITESKRAMLAVQESEQRFRSLFETMKEGVAVSSTDGRIVMTNPSMLAMLGRSEQEVSSMNMPDLHPNDALPQVIKEFEAHGRNEKFFSSNIPVQRKDGSVLFADVTTAWLTIDGVPHMGGIFHDVTERKVHIQQLTDALLQKDVLLREVYHRVKNNLQVVASMLYLQSTKIDEPETLRFFLESRDRVMAMSLVHEQLYNSEDLSRIDFAGYLRRLVSSLSHTLNAAARSIEMSVTAQGLPSLNLDQAVPCGLIVNELISNAMKHAFGRARRGTVSVDATQRDDGMIELTISDDGRGLPDPLNPSLGLQLVQSLVRQLSGTMETKSKGGARFTVRFPTTGARQSA